MLLGLCRGRPVGHFGTSPGPQFRTSPGWSNRFFMRRPGDVEGDVLRTSWETLFADWVDSQHPIMVHFIISSFVVIKNYSKVFVPILDLFHYTSINDELVNCTKDYICCSSLAFSSDVILCCMISHKFGN